MSANSNNKKKLKDILPLFSSLEALELYKLQTLLEHFKMSVFYYDIQKDILYIENASIRLDDFTRHWFKPEGEYYSFENLTGRLHEIVRASIFEYARKVVDEVRQNISGQMITFDAPLVYKEGNTRWTNFLLDTLVDKRGVPVYAIGYCKDVHRQTKEMHRLRNVAQTDWLTGFRNRAGGLVKIRNKIEEEKGKNCCFLAVIDLNKFKSANDLYGHAFGDLVLKNTAERIKDFFDHETICCRTGGDEFLFYRTCDDSVHALEFMTKLKAHLEHTVSLENARFDVSASVGISVSPLHGTDFDDLYNKADAAMYYAKKLEFKEPVLYEEKMDSVWL